MYNSSDSRVGEVLLDRYRVVGVLGSGGMGVVYEAEDQRLGRHVAIKVLQHKGSSFQQTDMGRRFQREAKAIAALVHPNLVTLLDYDILDDGTPAMVMERVDGVSLQKLLEVRKFTVDEIIELLCQALDALATCHDRGVVHRDLKPGNLLVQIRDGRPVVKVIDFGLTKLVSDEAATALTVNGQVFGSPRFMAPEQWLRRQVDGRTDLYAVGLIGYWLVTGDHFIQRGNPIDVCKAHLHQQRPALEITAGGEQVPPLLAQSIARAAHPDPAQRFPDARSMLASVQVLRQRMPAIPRTTGGMPAVPMPAGGPTAVSPLVTAVSPAVEPDPNTSDDLLAAPPPGSFSESTDDFDQSAVTDAGSAPAFMVTGTATPSVVGSGSPVPELADDTYQLPVDFEPPQFAPTPAPAATSSPGALQPPQRPQARAVQRGIPVRNTQSGLPKVPVPPVPPGIVDTQVSNELPPTVPVADAVATQPGDLEPEPAHSAAATIVASADDLAIPQSILNRAPIDEATDPAPSPAVEGHPVPLPIATTEGGPLDAHDEPPPPRNTIRQRRRPDRKMLLLMAGVVIGVVAAAVGVWVALV
ncbi:MAG: protein kinase domain-containing protein [Bradymonadia bacterium]